MKQFKVIIAGTGARGYHTYAKYQHLHPDKMKIVAIADLNKDKLKLCGDEFNIDQKFRFNSCEEMFEKNIEADVAFITTQDHDHVKHAIMALEKGYNILLEKPCAESIQGCNLIYEAAIKAKKLVVVCHVLRYTTFFRTVKNLIDSKAVGDIVNIDANENVSYWHQAHSFVRGNWCNDQKTTPMIVQKCCHDFDMISWLMNKSCKEVSSYGSLYYFKNNDAKPLRCKDCKDDKCPYNAYKIYLDNEVIGFNAGNHSWPVDIVCENPTIDGINEALDNGPYGKCVFHCDNNVVDHQTTNILFEDGSTAHLTMTAFTDKNYRNYVINGTLGQIECNQELNTVTLTKFGEKPIVYDINKLATDLSGHGGGDNQMLDEMFDALEYGKEVSSSIKVSIETHLMAFAAEKSRLNSMPVRIDEIRKGV